MAIKFTLQQLIDKYRSESESNAATNVMYLYVYSGKWVNVFSTSPDNFERRCRESDAPRYIIRSEEELISLLAMLEL